MEATATILQLDLRTCRQCSAVKDRTAFYRRGAACRPCVVSNYSTWKRNNPEKYHASNRRQALRKHGIDQEIFDRMLADQGGRCGLCVRTEPGGRNWHVDHDHACCPGVYSCGSCIRGLLCTACNVELGGYEKTAAKPGLAGYLGRGWNRWQL